MSSSVISSIGFPVETESPRSAWSEAARLVKLALHIAALAADRVVLAVEVADALRSSREEILALLVGTALERRIDEVEEVAALVESFGHGRAFRC